MSLEALQDRIREAAARRAPLRLRGGGSKDFYGNSPRGELLDTRSYAGIVAGLDALAPEGLGRALDRGLSYSFTDPVSPDT